MKELELNELKEIEFNILKMFDSFCKENNIKYYLGYGTLLGAIRYKKFIPWDDDVDVLVPREDYEKLLTIFKDSEQFKLFAFERNKDFSFPFAKLCDMTTRKEETVYKNKKVALGVEIDIFPLDAWNSSYKKAKREANIIKNTMMWLGATKLDNPLTNKPINRFLWEIIIPFVKIIGSEYFVKKIIRKSKSNLLKDSVYVGVKAWCVYGERGIIPAEVFEDTVYVEFEGEKFPAPVGYDKYLTCLYGDYMPEPPIEKQKTHHAFKAYRL